MLDAIRQFVTRRMLPDPDSSPDAAPEDPERQGRLAACALLLELAHADGEFSPAEQAHIESALGRHFGLDEGTTRELIELGNRERQASIDHFQFTRLIVEHYDVGQRMVLAEVMWGVILADGRIADHEGYLVRKLAHLLELPPAYLAEAKRAASQGDAR